MAKNKIKERFKKFQIKHSKENYEVHSKLFNISILSKQKLFY